MKLCVGSVCRCVRCEWAKKRIELQNDSLPPPTSPSGSAPYFTLREREREEREREQWEEGENHFEVLFAS